MKQRLLLFLALLLTTFGGARADEVEIGSLEGATSDSYLPMNSLYNYSYTQQIYTADEIGTGGTINSITMWLYGNADLYDMPFDIYMVETDKEAFESTTDWVAVTEGDIVYSGTVTVHNTEAEAYTFELSTPFEYSGVGNLVIAFNNTTGSWTAGLRGMVFGADSDPRAIYARQDGGAYDPYNPTFTAYSTTYLRNVITLDITPAGSSTCAKPENFVVSDITDTGATFTWVSEVGSYKFEYKKNADAEWTAIDGVLTETTYELEELTDNTAYQARVKAVCGSEDESGWKTISFTTENPCAVPANLAASEITAFSATISWTPGYGQNAWTVKYKKTADEEWTETTASGNPTITLEGLDGDTQYVVEVYNECEGSAGASIQFYTAETCPDGKICIGTGKATSNYVPAHNYYKYSLTQQIYTAAEIGDAGYIQSIDFFKANDYEMVKDLKIYIVATEKETFESSNDWISVTEADLAFSGTVTFGYNEWTTIELENPFEYNGLHNIAIIVDNNTGSYKSSTGFYVFDAGQNQTLYYQSDGTNLDPTADISGTSGTLMTLKNRIRLVVGEAPAVAKPRALTVNYTGGTTAEVSWQSEESEFELDVNGVVTTINSTSYTLTNLELSTTYEVKVRAKNGDDYSDWTTPVSFTTDDCMPEDQIVINYELTDSYGDGWNGNAILVVDDECNVVEQLTIVSGYSNSGTLRLCSTAVSFYWYKGNYPSETSWVFTDANGDPLFSGAGSNDMQTLDLLYTIDLNPYQVPSDIEVSEISGHTATVSWTENGTATAWQIMLINGENEEIIDANTNPFTLTGLDPETDYSVAVRAVGSEGTSLWPCLYSSFTTDVACQTPTDLVVSDVTATSALVSWLGFSDSYDLRYYAIPSSKGTRGSNGISSINKKPAKFGLNSKNSFANLGFAALNNKPAKVSDATGVKHNRDDWYYYDNGEYSSSIGTNGGNFYWGIMIPAGSYMETTLTKTSVYDIMAMTGTVTIYNDGTDAPAGDALATADVTLTGSSEFVETEFDAPVTIDPSKNLWIVYYNGSGATFPAAYCSEQTDANGRWISTDGTDWFDVNDAVSDTGDWMMRAYLEGAIDWIEVNGITESEYQLTNLDPETTYIVQIRSNCGDEGQSNYSSRIRFTTMGLNDDPYAPETTEVTATTATLKWTGAQDSYNLRYRSAVPQDPSTPATIILEAHDVWQDNSGYQMLLDANATAYGTFIPVSGALTSGGDADASVYAEFEYKIPENADGALETENIVFDGSVTIQIPAGTYDWCITNPSPGENKIWIAGTNGNVPGRYDDFVFEPGVTYHFTMDLYGTGDGAALEIIREWSEWTEVDNITDNPYVLTGLTPDTYYEWQVQGNLTEGTTEWSEIASFTTLEGADITFAKEGYATYYNGTKDVVLPAGMKAFVVTGGNGDTTLDYVAIADGDLTAATTNLVPADVAVMLQVAATQEDQTITVTLASPTATADFAGTNHLLGSDVDVEETTGLGLTGTREYFYKLNYSADGSGEFGWYWGADDGYPFASPAHKAWLVLENDNDLSSIAELPGHEGATGIQSVAKDTTAAEGWYTISGMKLDKQPTTKGLYIHNGKKVVVE